MDDIELTGDPAIDLILLEEMQGDNSIEVDEEQERPFFAELRDFTPKASFTPTRGETEQDSLPFKGAGRIDNLLVIADSETFDVQLAIDDREVVDDTYATLSNLSNELEHVSAYSREGEYIVVVRDYGFKESVHSTIRPRGDVTFKRVRVEGVIEDEQR